MVYSPPYNRLQDRAQLVAFMRQHNFPVLVTGSGGSLRASHLPALVQEEGGELALDMHMARANEQWRHFDDTEALVIFSGPHAYISPRWYEDTERVPTWNYAAVHAYGVPQLVEDRAAKHASQRRLVATLDPQWLPKFDALRGEYVERMLAAIVNFRIPVVRLETRWKLSQNRGRREMELIAAALEESGEAALAALTRHHMGD
ncbi:MAG: FMN-binding negative transcriptional regulator [Betaproteobacteria bacterium]|nr:MAG: FMN-binding negative transcriptional regulator [Betaproteobacteria bacterium]TMH41070.1 MAG: FMN-binding negative transcriptional regulator [Betaproteobacteria bacterium]